MSIMMGAFWVVGAVWCGIDIPMFRRYLLSPSSGRCRVQAPLRLEFIIDTWRISPEGGHPRFSHSVPKNKIG
jgi:hypothetical protein